MRTINLKTKLLVGSSILLGYFTAVAVGQDIQLPVETKKPATSTEDASKPLNRVVGNMQAIQDFVNKRELGPETQKLQAQVIDDLDKLINQLNKQSSSNNNSDQPPSQQKQPGKPPSKSTEAPPKQKKQSQQSQPGLTEGKRKKDSSAADSTGKTERGELTSGELARRQTLLKEVWGHLPPNVRQKILNDIYNEKYLPKYSELVRKYFEALAEKKQ